MRRGLCATLWLIGTLAACAGPRMPLPVDLQATPGTLGRDSGGKGILRIGVRWPQFRPGFAVAVIPDSARSLLVSVSEDERVLATRTVPRPAALSSSTVDFRLPPATNVSVRVAAYAEVAPDPLVNVPLAVGTAAGLNLISSLVTPARISLAPRTTPRISRLSYNVAPIGTHIFVYGENFHPDSQVFFNGHRAQDVTFLTTGALRALVPGDATVGPLTVRADGVPAANEASFWVIRSLQVATTKESWDLTPADQRLARFDTTFYLAASPSWQIESSTATYSAPEPGATVWFSSDPRGGAFDAPGLFRAGKEKIATLVSAGMGPFMGSTIKITPSGTLTAVALSTTSFSLYSKPASGDPSPSYQTEATISASVSHLLPGTPLIRWESSRPDLVTVAGGAVSATRAQQEGSALITAAMVDDPTLVATAAVKIHASGSIKVEID